ncbi:MAG: glycosyltransferase [Thermoanaerobaculia bacterium]|nr:glycosyltransferase [Thermoanaerobaculia bacterium]
MTLEPRTSVVVRSFNDRATVEQVLLGIRGQSVSTRILVFDNDSEDGTTEIARKLADEVIRVPRGNYIPGRVLNDAMDRCGGEFVVFLNADCTPEDRAWLEELLGAVDGDGVAAAFSRQMPRAGCEPLESLDIERCYGDGRGQEAARHTFSMASSAIRRSVWQLRPFDRDLRYSEDVDWTWRARQLGYRVVYAPKSKVFHSHNYSLAQLYTRYRGEGRAEARIFPWSWWQKSLMRYSVLPWGRKVLADWKHCARHGLWPDLVRSPLYRAVQAFGRRRGFLEGLAGTQGAGR